MKIIQEVNTIMALDIIIVFTIVAWVIFALALWKEDNWLGFIAGVFFLVLGIFAMIYGIQDTNNDLTRIYAFVNIGIGIYVSLVAAWEALG